MQIWCWVLLSLAEAYKYCFYLITDNWFHGENWNGFHSSVEHKEYQWRNYRNCLSSKCYIQYSEYRTVRFVMHRRPLKKSLFRPGASWGYLTCSRAKRQYGGSHFYNLCLWYIKLLMTDNSITYELERHLFTLCSVLYISLVSFQGLVHHKIKCYCCPYSMSFQICRT